MACNYQGLSKAFLSVSSVVAIFVHFGTILSGSAVEAAVACNSTNCVLPDCQCASMDIPRGLTKEQVPQMVTITLDGSLRLQDYNKFYSNLLRGRKNPNGQNISFTFFVNHNFTDYSLATELAGMGHEFAVHSVTNRQPMSFWSSGENDDEIEREIVVMKNLLVRWAGVPEDRVVGYRSPFLASSEDQLRILHENDFLYDSTVVTDDMYWPFTLDYKSPICNSQNVCPDQALPGLWVIPNVNNVQNNNVSCSQIVNCVHPPKSTYDQWMNFFKHNFERHYNDSKVPFRINAQAAWFFEDNMAERLQAFMDFMDYLATLDDVYIVTMSQLIAWSKSPTPLSEISSFQPWKFNNGPTQRVCSNKTSCSYNCNGSTDFNFLHICGDEVCPESYPTLYNPEGIIDNDVCLSSTYEIQSMSVSSRLDIAVPSTSYELFQTTVSNSPQDQSSGDFANAHITSTVPISSNVISSMSASQSAVPSILNTMTTEGIRLQTSSDSTMPIASASEPARIIVSSMASNSAGQPEMMTTISHVEFLTESSSAMGTSTTGENSMQTVLNSMLLSESRTLLAETVAITTSSSITVSDSVSTVDALEDSMSGAVVASEQTSDALSMAITTSSSITAVVSVLYSTVEDSTSGTVVASEQTSDALSMAITTSSSITAVVSVLDSTVDSLEDSTSGAVVASEQTSDVPSSSGIMRTHYPSSSSMGTFTTDKGYMQTVTLPGESSALLAETIAIATSSSITAVVSVSDSASDYLAETLSSAVEASKQTSVSGAEIMSTQYLSSGTSESAHSSPPVSSSISVSTTSPVGGGLQGGSNRGLGLSPGVAAAIAIGVVVIVATAVAVTAGLGVVAVKSELAATASQSTILSNPLTSPV